MQRCLRSLLLLSLVALPPTLWAAGLQLLGESELVAALRSQPPCCVVDARSAARQHEQALADAIRYRPGLRIVPTAAVVVIADDDAAAQRVGRTLARQHPGKSILAVRGGVAAWLSTRQALESSASPAPGKGFSFVIPHNTCETGQPLQVLQGKP